jgi:hypothetical protein
MPGALEGGHLEDALAWLESHRADFRVPVISGLPEAAAAEEWLAGRGQRRLEGPAVLMRDASAPGFSVPARVDLYQHTRPEESEAFGDPFVESLDLAYWMAITFMVLSDIEEEAAEGWRCYSAVDGHDHEAYAAMSIDSDVAMLARMMRECL